MSECKVMEIKKNILEDNDREADVLRSELKADRTFLLNLMSSPGSGKTTTLVRTIGALKDEMRIGVMPTRSHRLARRQSRSIRVACALWMRT